MQVKKQIKNLTEPEQAQFEEYLDKKLIAIAPVVESHYPDSDTAKATAKIQKFDKHSAFEFSYVFELPKKRFVSREVKHTITEAMDSATEKMEQQIVKHFKRLVKD
ncbi:MAG: hypothetical protein WC846_03265 [Candidatus Gracilibacteria bacterium]|jgi:ribosome-associated translation inhibitor RaiA